MKTFRVWMKIPIRQSAVSLGAACLLLAGGACGSSGPGVTTPGVTSGAITVGSDLPLTGPAAPGYSDIGAASQAFFNYVNAHGGVFGRSIHLVTINDAYDPTQTVSAVNQLVFSDSVFGIFDGVGTSTQARVLPLLNAHGIPDLFVASGCPCFEHPPAAPYAYGWQPNATIEGKILGWYIRRRYPGQSVGVLYHADGAGRAGLAGLRQEVPGAITARSYLPGTTTLLPQVRAIRDSGARAVVDLTLPSYTAIEQVTSLKLHYRPHLVVWSAGIDPRTVARLEKVYSAGHVRGYELIDGAITDAYLPPLSDSSDPWIRLFKSIYAKYDSHAPFDAGVEYGMASAYTFVEALRAAGKGLTREGLITAIAQHGRSWRGPGLVPFGYTAADHGGFTGAQLAQVQFGKLVLFGRPLITTGAPGSPMRVYRGSEAMPPRGGIPRG